MSVTPVLKRFEIVVFKNGTGNVQLPAAAQVDFYRQGATVANSWSPDLLEPDEPMSDVPVYHHGALVDGDIVARGTNLDETMVVQIDPGDPNKLTLTNNTEEGFVLDPNDRLVPIGDRPKVYQDPTGAAPVTPNVNYIMTNSNDGRGSCYIPAFRFDYIVVIDPSTMRLFIDADGSFVMRT